jgi:uncharacterized protein (TIGR00297 family)
VTHWFDVDPLLGVGLSIAFAVAAGHRGSLSPSGVVAAAIVGSSTWLGLGHGTFVVLCVFFGSSSLLGRVRKRDKQIIALDYAKGDRRDAWQVLANGGPACLAGLLAQLDALPMLNHAGSPTALRAIACASIASANADTWATELGVLARSEPWHLRSLKRVPRGTSGAVSGLGTAVALSGAATIATSAWATGVISGSKEWLGICLLGLMGAILDSLLGATLQRQYRCAVCGKRIEAKMHCAVPSQTAQPRWAILDNDQVNFLANLAAALAMALVVS